ncbi:MAG: bifunctional phosphoribosyl-AMP cyclohydrolase/phosphoribosyl-ATP diphosphatase HisIE [Ginsengibacter sp.]
MSSNKPDFEKYPDQLIPVIIQDFKTSKVLMLGFMNKEALDKTLESKLVTFYSRSKMRLWTKGETSNNYLHLVDLKNDCDNDTLLILARPDGPVCHTGADTCFNEKNEAGGFVSKLENIIEDRLASGSSQSYTHSLVQKGINKVAQKVGEEAVELIIEAMRSNENDFKNEAADLLYHYLILLQAKGYKLKDIEEVLKERHSK